MLTRLVQFVMLAALAAGAASTVCAQSAAYPARQLRFVVPFAPGGPNDVIARIVGQKLTEVWGQAVVIENRGGAGGTIGLDIALKAPADGYTIAMGGSSSVAVAPGLYARLAYDPLRDLTAIVNVAFVPYAMAVNPRVPAKTVRELVAVSKTQKGGLSYSTAGAGSMSHLATELLKSASGADLLHVPYKGAALGVTDLIAGQIDMTIQDYAALAPFAKLGKLRLLAVAGSRRAAVAPQLPTIAEAGVKDYAVDAWFGIVAPAGVPKDIVVRLNAAIVAGLKSADVKQRFVDLGYETIGDSPEQFMATIRTDIEKFGRVIRAAGIKAE
jgi:tripartite-type tricarboxylate transporter receptor subunit TctC